jgi:pimeloyl-ACP methyl ester carboxylesterase
MAKPTFIFVHGAWRSKEYFDRVIALLEPLGHKCVALSMPSVGRYPPVKSLDEHIATIRSAVLAELELGNDVIMNAHSWGAIPTTSALDGLSKAERASEGKKGGVVKLTFVSAWLRPKGVSAMTKIGSKRPGWIVDDVSAGLSRVLLQ